MLGKTLQSFPIPVKRSIKVQVIAFKALILNLRRVLFLLAGF